MRLGAVEKLENFYDALRRSRKAGELLPVKKVDDASKDLASYSTNYSASQVINSGEKNLSYLNFFPSRNVNSIGTLHQKE